MPKFELDFDTYFNDGEEKVFNASRYTRVIFAENEHWGRVVAMAMAEGKIFSGGSEAVVRGEEINHCEYLDAVKEVSKTDKEYTLYWDDSRAWERVLKRLGLKEENVDFVFGPKGQKVGFILKPLVKKT
ncbi:MAG: hypothetical protein AAB527_02095 [Patescibacteria group bacterium]